MIMMTHVRKLTSNTINLFTASQEAEGDTTMVEEVISKEEDGSIGAMSESAGEPLPSGQDSNVNNVVNHDPSIKETDCAEVVALTNETLEACLLDANKTIATAKESLVTDHCEDTTLPNDGGDKEEETAVLESEDQVVTKDEEEEKVNGTTAAAPCDDEIMAAEQEKEGDEYDFEEDIVSKLKANLLAKLQGEDSVSSFDDVD